MRTASLTLDAHRRPAGWPIGESEHNRLALLTINIRRSLLAVWVDKAPEPGVAS